MPPDMSHFTPAEHTTRVEDIADAREKREAEPSLLEGVGAAVKSEWMGSWALRAWGGEEFEPDFGFRWNEDLYDELTEGLPTDRNWFDEYLVDATSEPHARYLRQELDKTLKNEKVLSDLGWTGTGLRIGAAMLDPAAMAAVAATEGFAAPMVFATKAERIRRLLKAGRVSEVGQVLEKGSDLSRKARATRGAAVGGITNLSIEGVLASQDPTRDETDALIAGALGVGLGAGIGAMMPADNAVDRAFIQLGHDAKYDQARAAGFEPTDAGAKELSGLSNTPDWPVKQVTSRKDEADFAATLDDLDTVTPGDTAMGRFRVDMTAYLKDSQHPDISRLGGMMAEDAVGYADGRPATQTASEFASRTYRAERAHFARAAKPAFNDWAKTNSVPYWKREWAWDDFMEEVGNAARRAPEDITDPHIRRAADEFRASHRRMLQLAKKEGVEGFSDIPEDPRYVMRLHSINKIENLRARHGQDALVNMVRGAILRGSDGLTEEQAEKLARTYLKHVNDYSWQTDASKARMFSQDQEETLRKVLEEQGTLSEEEIESLLYATTRGKDQAKISRARRRLDVDETYVDPATGIGFSDILENNAAVLHDTYSRQLSGAVAWRRVREAMAQDGEDVVPSFDALVSRLEKTAADHGMTREGLQAQVKRLGVLYKSIVGLPLQEHTPSNRAIRALMDFNFMRVMGQAGFAQMAEIGNVLGQTTIRSAMKGIPAFGSMVRRMKNGEIEDGVVRELSAMLGRGEEMLMHHTSRRSDDFMLHESASGFGKAMEVGKKITANASMAPVNTMLHRWTLKSIAQSFADGREISPTRLASMGLSPDDYKAINRQIKKYGSEEPGFFGNTLNRLNLDKWDDETLRSKFIVAVDRQSTRIIQENDIGNFAAWMTSPVGRMMVQFRSFMSVAWAKQFLYGVNNRDMRTAIAWNASMVAAGMAYSTQTFLNSVGREDQAKFLSDRLNPAELGKAAFQRAGFATIFPAAVDSIGHTIMGADPVFAYGRSTGLAASLLQGNPTVDTINKMQGSVRGALAPVINREYDYSDQDWRNQSQLVPFQNMLGVRNVQNMLHDSLNLPKTSK